MIARSAELFLPACRCQIETEELALPLLQLLLFLDLPDLVVGKLLKTFGTLLIREREGIRDAVELACDLAEDFFAAADGMVEHADAR